MTRTDVRFPDLGDAVKAARLVSWLKPEGAAVIAGEPIAEVETDKTSIEIVAPCSGTLQSIRCPAGTDNVAIESVLGVIVTGDAAPAPAPSASAAAPASTASPATPRPAVPYAAPAEDVPMPSGIDDAARATPLAIRMAVLAGIPVSMISGSGANGRIRKVDVETALGRRRPAGGAASVATSPPPPSAGERRDVRGVDTALSPMRRVTADRLSQSKQTIPHFYLRVDCIVDELVKLRAELESDKVSITVLAVRAAALALREVPQANSSWVENSIRIHTAVDIAVAVSTPAGLITPIVRNADWKPLATIAQDLKALTVKARAGRLEPDEYHGATFTISNLGMHGISSLFPIINPPQSCILGVGALEQKPIVRSGGIAIGTMMSCTLAADHRVLDGVAGAKLLAEVRARLEHPQRLLA